MITRAFIAQLHCPYCGSRLEAEGAGAEPTLPILNGVVRCACYRYPIVDAILILKQQSAPSNNIDARVQALDEGKPQLALERSLNMAGSADRPRWRRVLDTLRGSESSAPKSSLAACSSLPLYQFLQRTRPQLYADYLFQRYANDSFLASLAPLLLLQAAEPATPALGAANARVLELTCGIGHSAFLITTLFPRLDLIATDHDVANLYVARKYMAPRATYVCIDAEVPLPFPDDFFTSVFCLDGFHYIRSKVALIEELARAVDDSGMWIFPHLHNAAATNFAPGTALTSHDYLRCFHAVSMRLFNEAEGLRRFFHERALDLRAHHSAVEIKDAQTFLGVASADAAIWRNHAGLMELLVQAAPLLTINPIYAVQPTGNKLSLTMRWPSARLQEECRAVMEYLPGTAEIDASLLARLRDRNLRETDLDTVRELVRKFVLVLLPPGYTDAT